MTGGSAQAPQRALDRIQTWRSVEGWPRRSSFVLGGTLAFAGYLLAAVALFAHQGFAVSLIVGTIATLLCAATFAEVAYAIRPSEAHLERADQILLVAVGAWFLLLVAGSLAYLFRSVLG